MEIQSFSQSKVSFKVFKILDGNYRFYFGAFEKNKFSIKSKLDCETIKSKAYYIDMDKGLNIVE